MIFVTKASWQGAQQQSTARAAGACIVYRADLPGVVKWRLVTPCGHWCCGTCEEHLVQEAAREERPLLCPDCRAPVITGYQEGVAWAGDRQLNIKNKISRN